MAKREAAFKRHTARPERIRAAIAASVTLLVVAATCFVSAQRADAAGAAVRSNAPAGSGATRAFLSVYSSVPRPEKADPTTLPRTRDGKPDLSGIWLAGIQFLQGRSSSTPQLTASYAAREAQWRQAMMAGTPFADSSSRCQALGMPRTISLGFIEFILQPRIQLTTITETLHEIRRIYLDGRTHPADFEPSFDGHSIGHWEGDTLVIDTVGFMANNLTDTAWHSDKMHIVERISMPNRDGLINQMTIDDPEALQAPWTTEHYYKRQLRGYEMEEYVCTNNRNAEDEKGAQTAK